MINVGETVYLKSDGFQGMTVTEIEHDVVLDADGKPQEGAPKGVFVAWFDNSAKLAFARLPLAAVTTLVPVRE